MNAPNQGFYYFLVKQNHLEDLLIQALNLITDGVQIYDENGYALDVYKRQVIGPPAMTLLFFTVTPPQSSTSSFAEVPIGTK